ncbi:Protein phosphatase 2C C10F6.17c [Grifola frondosa]|uniref:Protein phosphatase 2C C10F6.17c n=1 Tax=Grifola frondosa TaxID=5627 RepID=A0A1C7LTW3_GRIFR|nr:Protein phosphatase 2C C10F6.17c [Grifola frondosa]
MYYAGAPILIEDCGPRTTAIDICGQKFDFNHPISFSHPALKWAYPASLVLVKPQANMGVRVVNLSPATTSDCIGAFDEVKDFAVTDMGRGGPDRWTYRILREPGLTAELDRLSNPRSVGAVHSVTFQPCRSYHHRSQDRYTVEEWRLPGGTWTCTAIFDGHMNHDAVEVVSHKLSPRIKESLESLLRTTPAHSFSPELVSSVLSQAITQLDNLILSEFLELFPGGHIDMAHVRQVINDQSGTGEGYRKTASALGGTTALVALTDPAKANIWVANLGDCCAVLGTRDESGSWHGTLINSIHNGSNPTEVQRIRSEHPAETDCVRNERVLGFLAPTRGTGDNRALSLHLIDYVIRRPALGDAWLKLPAQYTEKVFSHLEADWLSQYSLHPHASQITTPPYVSNKPDVYHMALKRRVRNGSFCGDGLLIMCSDGLTDLYEGFSHEEMADDWVRVVGEEADSIARGERPRGTNLASVLLRDAVGGSDEQLLSRNLTVEMEERWIDDTTIVVQLFL